MYWISVSLSHCYYWCFYFAKNILTYCMIAIIYIFNTIALFNFGLSKVYIEQI